MTEKKYTVTSSVRQYLKDQYSLNLSMDFASELEKQMQVILDQAASRASKNGRKTVYGRDL